MDQTSGEVTVMRELDRDIAAVVRITVLVIDTTAPTTQQGKGILYFHSSVLLSVFSFIRILTKSIFSAIFLVSIILLTKFNVIRLQSSVMWHHVAW